MAGIIHIQSLHVLEKVKNDENWYTRKVDPLLRVFEKQPLEMANPQYTL